MFVFLKYSWWPNEASWGGFPCHHWPSSAFNEATCYKKTARKTETLDHSATSLWMVCGLKFLWSPRHNNTYSRKMHGLSLKWPALAHWHSTQHPKIPAIAAPGTGCLRSCCWCWCRLCPTGWAGSSSSLPKWSHPGEAKSRTARVERGSKWCFEIG